MKSAQNNSDKTIGKLSYKLFNNLIENPDELNKNNNHCIQFVSIHLYKAEMKKELQENFTKVIDADKEIYNKFIVGFDNLIDWVVENKIFSKETRLKNLLNKISKEVSIADKIRLLNHYGLEIHRFKKNVKNEILIPK